MILNLNDVSLNVVCSKFSLVAGLLMFTAKFFRMFIVVGRGFHKRYELLGNHLTLSLSRSGRWHGAIIADVMKLEGIIELFSS